MLATNFSSASGPHRLQARRQKEACAGLQSLFDVGRERIETAREGKRLVDEGGEPFVQVLLAKKASIDAAEIDKNIVEHLQVTIAALQDSSAKLRLSDTLKESSELSFAQLANEHLARGQTLQGISNKLAAPLISSDMNAAQHDALSLVKAKTACSTWVERTAASSIESFDKFERYMFSNTIPINKDVGTDICSLSEQSSVTPGILGSLWNQAHVGLQAAMQAANDRFDTAKGGKQLFEESDHLEQIVLAKRASMDAALLYKSLVQKVHTAMSLLEESSTLLKKAQSEHSFWCMTVEVDIAGLAKAHDERSRLYRQIAQVLEVGILSSELNSQEYNVLTLVKMRDGAHALKCKTVEGLQAIKTSALAGCAA